MKARALAATVAAFAMASAAYAADNPSAPAAARANSGATQNDATASVHAPSMTQQMRADLSKAGFTDIKATPESFLVRAKDKQGNPVMMVINPDSFAAITETSSGNTYGSTAANNSGAQTNGGSQATKP